MPRSGRVPGIFISYRRDDSAGFAGRLYDRLSARFGAEHVFMDIDTITPGHEFAADIERALSECDACIVLIGRQWESITLPDGRRRLEDPTDFVRLEVAAAIRRGITVFPVLVEGAKPPAAASLPEDIRDVSGRQAIELSNERWNYDVGRLILALEQLGRDEDQPQKETPEGATRRPAMVAGGVAVLVVAALVVAFAVTRGRGTAGPSPTSPSRPTSPTSPTPSVGACSPVPGSPGACPGTLLSGNYIVSLQLESFSGTDSLGGDNILWGVKDPEARGPKDDWSAQGWTFAPNNYGVVWKVPKDRPHFEAHLEQGGTFKSFGSATCVSAGPVPVERAFSLDDKQDDASGITTFKGTMTISWACPDQEAVDATFNVTGARIDGAAP